MYVLINLGNRENHLVSVSGNGTTTTFVYDGDGNRVRKTVTGSEDILYINKYYEKNLTTGNVTTNYYLGDRLVAQRGETTLRYIHQDHLSGTSLMTVPTDRKFTGQRLDDTGLYYYGARYYDPEIGRFISADTFVQYPANPQSFNRYSYCLNNPLRYIDPSGHIVTVEGFNVNDIENILQDPLLLAVLGGSDINLVTGIVGSEEYGAHQDVRDQYPDQATNLEKSKTVYEVVVSTPDLPVSTTSTTKTVSYYSETNRSYHIPIPTNTEVSIKYGPTNESWRRLGEFLTGVIFTAGGSIMAVGTIIIAVPSGPLGWGASIFALYTEFGIIFEGVNKIVGEDIMPNLIPLTGTPGPE